MADNRKIFFYVSLGVFSLAALVFIFRKKIMKVTGEAVSDILSEAKIKTLHPKIREKAREFLNKAEKQSIKLRITSGYRTFEEQDKLYNQGRTTEGGIITMAKSGESSHNYGTAIDVVPLENGQPNWNSTEWSKIGEIGKSIGFAWGGDWKNFIDKPHFEMNFGNSLAQLKQKVDSSDVENGFVVLT